MTRLQAKAILAPTATDTTASLDAKVARVERVCIQTLGDHALAAELYSLLYDAIDDVEGQ